MTSPMQKNARCCSYSKTYLRMRFFRHCKNNKTINKL